VLVSRTGIATALPRDHENRPVLAFDGARPEGLAERRGGHHDFEAGSTRGWLTLGKNVAVVGAFSVGVAGITVAGDRLRRVLRRSASVKGPP
ncbi:MAG: hypothetical protein NZQ09_16570, partial [Chloroflexus sp.]|nr:hypothetical protein [Chloroflexus sp.]